MQKFRNRGFTLIELLVVISIIGILSSFAIVSLNSARIKARDALRKGDMAQLRTALYLYYDDAGAYPVCNPDNSWDPAQINPPFGYTPESGSSCFNNEVKTVLTTGEKPLMMTLPKEPRNPLNQPTSVDPSGSNTFLYRYISNNSGDQYAIIYYLEEDPLTPQVIRGF